MLILKDVVKRFGVRCVLNGASLCIPKGSLAVLEGRNGTGKSTVFNLITGSIHHEQGDIELDGRNLGSLSAKDRAHRIAILHQDPKASSVGQMTLEENFILALKKGQRASFLPATSQKKKARILDHLARLELPFALELHRPMADLSGGQRQLAVFAMATITKPELLLLDEPTAALDTHSAELLMNLVKRFAVLWQIPVLMVSHDHHLNASFADQIFQLDDGKIVLRKA